MQSWDKRWISNSAGHAVMPSHTLQCRPSSPIVQAMLWVHLHIILQYRLCCGIVQAVLWVPLQSRHITMQASATAKIYTFTLIPFLDKRCSWLSYQPILSEMDSIGRPGKVGSAHLRSYIPLVRNQKNGVMVNLIYMQKVVFSTFEAGLKHQQSILWSCFVANLPEVGGSTAL